MQKLLRNGLAHDSGPETRRRRELRDAATMFNSASHPGRLQILLVLAEGPRDTGQLGEELGGLDMVTVSQRLQELRQGNLVESRRHGRHQVYDVTKDGFRLVRLVRKLCLLSEDTGPLPNFRENLIVFSDAENREDRISQRRYEPV